VDTPPLGIVILATRRGVWSAFCAQARRFRLTGQQFWAVLALNERPGLTPGALADELLLDAPAASRIVSELSRRRLVESRPDRSDRRRTLLYLTGAGDALAGELAAARLEFRDALEEGLTPEQVAALRGGLRRILANARALEDGHDRAAANAR
jgi:DNA-binding MarR family transcriptional regulator